MRADCKAGHNRLVRPGLQLKYAAAIRDCESRMDAAAAMSPSSVSRFAAQTELVRKAWQVLLCAEWEARHPKARAKRKTA